VKSNFKNSLLISISIYYTNAIMTDSTGDIKNTNVVSDGSIKGVFKSTEHNNKKKVQLLIGGLIIVLIIAVVWYISAQSSLNNMQQYTYVNSVGNKYSFDFYKGSQEKLYGFGNYIQTKALVSPVLENNGVSIAVAATTFPFANVNSASVYSQPSKECAIVPNSSEAFTVQVKALDVNAVFCTTDQVYYYSYFNKGSTLYYLQIAPFDPLFNPTSGQYSAADIRYAPTVSSVRVIAGSFAPLTTTKTSPTTKAATTTKTSPTTKAATTTKTTTGIKK